MPMTNYLAAQLLNEYFWLPTNYLALHTTDPTAAGISDGEIAGGSYERQPLLWTLPAARTLSNSSSIVFHNLPDAVINYFGIWTLPTGGYCLYTLHLPTTVTSAEGDTFSIPVNDLSILMD